MRVCVSQKSPLVMAADGDVVVIGRAGGISIWNYKTQTVCEVNDKSTGDCLSLEKIYFYIVHVMTSRDLIPRLCISHTIFAPFMSLVS